MALLADVDAALVEMDPFTALNERGLASALQDLVPSCYFLRFLLGIWQATPMVGNPGLALTLPTNLGIGSKTLIILPHGGNHASLSMLRLSSCTWK